MTDSKSGPQGRRLSPPLSEKAAARRRAFETVSGERAWRDQAAREVLNARAIDKGWGGRWPCYMQLCSDGKTPDSILHERGAMTLVHVSRIAERYGIRLRTVHDRSIPPTVIKMRDGTTFRDESVQDTDRAAVCRPCLELMRDHARFDDTPDWEGIDHAR
ncbi:hypothetical protein STPH1_3371 [Streptomyces sp. OM5714]|nr:hypothetical protein STPH1_3371 [Streptomyces sp. OM5714]